LLTKKWQNQGFLLDKSSLRKLTVATTTWLTVMEYLCHKWPRYVPLVVNISRSFPHSWFITGFVTKLTRRVPLVEQELLTISEQMNSPPILSGVRVTLSLVWYVCFVDRCLSFLCCFFWLLCWLFLCNTRILIAPLVSSNFSYNMHYNNSAPMSTFSLLCLMNVETVCCFFILWSPVVSLCCWGVVVVVIVFGIYSYICNQCASLQTLFVWIPLRRGVLDTTLCDHVYQGLTTGQWSSLVTPVFSTNKIDSRDLAEILLKVALSTISLSLTLSVLIDL
jgi:hypothetical protein